MFAPRSSPTGSHNSQDPPRVIKEGQLFKRGENVRNWRSRYFILYTDGTLTGFKSRPDPSAMRTEEPWNIFSVKGCQIMRMDRPKPFGFIVRGSRGSGIFERSFCAETHEERDSWISAIESVDIEHGVLAESLNQQPAPAQQHVQSHQSQEMQKVTLQHFDFLKVLGRGTFGKVILCREKKFGQLFAIKILRKQAMVYSEKDIHHTLTENRVLQTTSHPFLIKLKCSFQTGEHLCFVMEYVSGGDFHSLLKVHKRFSEETARFYGAEIVSAIGYLHQKGIIYRDLKPENVLLAKDGHIKIADFGLCKERITFGRTTNTFCGTPEFFAPEVLENEDAEYGLAVDWWCLGIMMYEMMTGRLPFSTGIEDTDKEILMELILLKEVKYPSWISADARSLLEGLFRKNPMERLGGGPTDTSAIMEHPFFRTLSWTDLVQKKIPPPYIPQLSSETDTRYFDPEFTEAHVDMTPNVNNEEIPGFQGFSYKDLSIALGASLQSGAIMFP